MLDNASNNDTFVEGIERRAKKAGVPFNASWARLRCMPHTIHLAAIKVWFLTTLHMSAYVFLNLELLEAIGAISSAEGKKAASRAGNYQDATTASLDRDLDHDATTQDDVEGDPASHAIVPNQSESILSSVAKVQFY
jgi:hypothetical protein